jgi:hypothetical protein
MATTLDNLAAEITKVFEAVQEYSQSLGSYVFNPSSNPYPAFRREQAQC